MKGSVKRTGSRDETEMVGVQGSTEAEASSHQPRKRCRKGKVVEASSDQSQEGGGKAEVVEGSSDQTKKRGPKAKLPPGESKERKKVRDKNRYENMKDAVRVIRDMGPQMEILKNKNAEFGTQLEKVNSELLPAITQDMKTMKEDIEIVKNDYKKMGSLIEGFLQSKLKENDWEIPLDCNYLDGKESWSSEAIPNVEHLLTDLDYPPEMFDLVGMSRQEILSEFQKIRNSIEESKRENEKCYEELKRENEGLKRENEELKRENKMLNSRMTAVETLKNK